MRHLLLFICLSLNMSQLYAWTRTADFEGGVVGDYAEGPNALTTRAAQATFTDQITHTGKRALKAEVQQGRNAYGGRISLPAHVREGEEIWYRAYWYYPTGFDFTTGSEGLKTMRINTSASTGGGTGFLTLLVSSTGGKIRPGSEVNTKAFYNNLFNKYPGGNVGQKIGTGVWHCFETYVKFSSVPGNGVWRIWQNGKLVFEDNLTETLRASGGKSDYVLVGNYFNGGSQKTQAAYVDDIVITNQRPSQVDSYGNPMIGLAGAPVKAPPNPPSYVQ